jgi:hypothetical protein
MQLAGALFEMLDIFKTRAFVVSRRMSLDLERAMTLGVQLALHIAMMDHGIEHDLTAVIAADLGIDGVEDLADMPWAAVLRVPKKWRQRIMLSLVECT